MKNLILSLAATFIFTLSAFASNSPVEEVKILNSENIEVMVDVELSEIFTSTMFNENDNTLEFTSKEKVNYIQIFNTKGELQYQLPVLSKKVKIGKSLFGEKGDYKLGFLVQGKKEIKFSEIKIRN